MEWPTADSSASITLTVLGEDPFGEFFDEIEGKVVRGKKLVIKRVKSLKNLGECHILFISVSEKNQIAQIVKSLKGLNILTVGDTEGFAQKGVILNFCMEQKKVGFEINVEAANRAGLKISSSLLKLAKIVHD